MLALGYLARYAASRATVARYLHRRVENAEASGRAQVVPEEIGPLLDDLERLGLIDDDAFARTKGGSLSRRGYSARGLAARLKEAGVDEAPVQGALEALEDEGDSDLKRAWRYAKRRRIGPYRPSSERVERRMRDLAALARRGFDLQIAKAVIDAVEADDSPGPPAALTEVEDRSS